VAAEGREWLLRLAVLSRRALPLAACTNGLDMSGVLGRGCVCSLGGGLWLMGFCCRGCPELGGARLLNIGTLGGKISSTTEWLWFGVCVCVWGGGVSEGKWVPGVAVRGRRALPLLALISDLEVAGMHGGMHGRWLVVGGAVQGWFGCVQQARTAAGQLGATT
jgi:hypothetical protein